MVALTPGPELIDEPCGDRGLLDRVGLGQQLAGLQGVATTSHGRESQIRELRVEPEPRSPRRPRPVAREFGSGGLPDLHIAHGRQDVQRRPPEDREPVPDQLGSGDSGQDPLHHRPVCPGRVQDLQVEQLGAADVSQVEACAAAPVEASVERRQGDHEADVDRSVHDGNQVEITHAEDVVAVATEPATSSSLTQPSSCSFSPSSSTAGGTWGTEDTVEGSLRSV